MKKIFFIYFFIPCFNYSGYSQLPAITDINDGPSKEISLSDNAVEDEDVISGNGDITGYHSSGEKLFRGYMKKGQLHSSWVSWYGNGNRIDSGRFQNGIPDGRWQVWYENGKPKFVRTYSAEKWERFMQEVSRYHPRRISYPVTQLYHESKSEAEKYLSGIYTFCTSLVCNRDLKENILQVARNNNEEKHYHPVFTRGLLHGLYINYFPNRAIKDSGYYQNGLPEGVWIKWSDDGNTFWKGFYHHGLKSSEWKLHSADGRLLRLVYFKKGKEQWRKEINGK